MVGVTKHERARVLARMQEADVLKTIYAPMEEAFRTNLTKAEVDELVQVSRGIEQELQIWERYAEHGNYIARTQNMTLADCSFYPVMGHMRHRGFKVFHFLHIGFLTPRMN
jgi:hypothetical protein